MSTLSHRFVSERPPAFSEGRVLVPEILDTLAGHSPDARRARRDLRIFNRVMGNEPFFLTQLRHLKPGKIRILEIGAGSGELARRLIDEGFQVDALDRCPAPIGWPEGHRWYASDVRAFDRWAEYPVVIANLFLHHLSSAELRALGERWSKGTQLILASEPARRRRFLYLFLLTCVLCRANAVSRHDGWASINAGFSNGELARELGLDSAEWEVEARVRGRGAYRFLAKRKP